MRTSEQTDKIDEQIALVQSEVGQIAKDKEVRVEGSSKQTGEAYGYKSGYATLAALDTAARPACTKYGVAVYQGGSFVQGLGPVLETRLAYKGQWIESYFPIKAQGEAAQKIGGGISFARRWGLCGMLNLIPSDAEESQGYTEARRDARQPRRASAPAGLPDTLVAIREAPHVEALARAAQGGRGAFPKGEEANAIEKTISTWYATAFAAVTSADQLVQLRASANAVKPRGTEVRDAIGAAEARVKVGAS